MSPRTKSISTVRFSVLTVSSYVSSSTSTVVIVSDTLPNTMFRWLSYACVHGGGGGERSAGGARDRRARVEPTHVQLPAEFTPSPTLDVYPLI